MRWVCRDCLQDESLSDLFAKARSKHACSFCGQTDEPGVVGFDRVLRRVRQCVYEEYSDADDEFTPRDGDGEGYVGGSTDRHNLLLDLGLNASDPVLNAIAETLPDLCWVKKSFSYVDYHDAMQAGWEEFVRYVRSFSEAPEVPAPRAVFGREVFGVETADGYVDPGHVLTAISELTMRLRLVKRLPKGTALYRCRPKRVDVASVSELGPPRPEWVTKPGRMNRAGVAYFYGAFDRKTAIMEVCSDGAATLGYWVTLRPLNVLDITDLPAMPGFFHRDPEERHGISFFHGFALDLRKDVKGEENVGYLPSILVAEHFRANLGQIDGIVYLSAKNNGGKNCILFFGPDDCATASRRGNSHVLRLLPERMEWLNCAAAMSAT
jgi:hypothetical protein